MTNGPTEHPPEEDKYLKGVTIIYRLLLLALAFLGLLALIRLTSNYFADSDLKIYYIFTECIVFLLILLQYIRKTLMISNKKLYINVSQIESDFLASNSKTEYLYNRVDESYKQFKDSTSWTYRNVRFYKYSITALSALATIILGLSYGFITDPAQAVQMTKLSKDIALILSTIITALTTLSVFWNMEKYWIQNKVIKQQLKILKYEIGFELVSSKQTQTVDEVAVKSHLKNYLRILKDFHLYWEGALTDRAE